MEQGSEFVRQKRLLDYWRAAIKNESIIGIKIEQGQYRDYFFPKKLLGGMGFDESFAEKLFVKYKRFLVKPKSFDYSNDDEQSSSKQELVLPVRIAPSVYGRKHEHSKYQQSQKLHYIHPVWIAAYLRKTGELFADYPCLLPPWISREYLHPTYQQQELITIGNLSDYDTFLDKNSINSSSASEKEKEEVSNEGTPKKGEYKNDRDKERYISWKELYDYSEKMLETVAPDLLKYLGENGYSVDAIDKVLVIPTEDNNKNYSNKLLKLLDSLATEKTAFSPLLARYLTLEPSREQPLKSTEEQLEYAAPQHVAQMNGVFALAKSQRVALHHLFLVEEGQMLAINGPPGTGKTALLASIIASFWVQAAIKRKPPPIIVVSSTNNRAITNVIDSFENKIDITASSTPEGQLATRWIEGVHSFGLYFTGQARGSYQYYRDVTNGTLQEVEKEKTYFERKNYFLEKFNQFFNLNISCVEKAANVLHGKMVELESSLQSVLKISTKYKSLLKRYPKHSKKHLLAKKISHLSTRLEALKTESGKLEQFKIAWHTFLSKQAWYQPIAFLLPFLKKLVKKSHDL